MKKSQTNLGRYLFSIRIERGYSQISEYLREYNLTISDVYYRDLESGRKSLSVDTADTLCTALQADRKAFFGHYLRDILPTDVIEALIRPFVDETFSSLKERQAVLQRDRGIYQEAFARSLLADSHVLTEAAVQSLVERPNLMPILHLLYAMESVSSAQLASAIRRNGIDLPAREVAEEFVRVELAYIDEEPMAGNEWRLRRRALISRVPVTDAGMHLKREFAHREVEKTLRQPAFNPEWTSGGGFYDTSIVELTAEAMQHLRERVLGMLAEAYAAGGEAGKGATPCFLGVFLGVRPEYGPDED